MSSAAFLWNWWQLERKPDDLKSVSNALTCASQHHGTLSDDAKQELTRMTTEFRDRQRQEKGAIQKLVAFRRRRARLRNAVRVMRHFSLVPMKDMWRPRCATTAAKRGPPVPKQIVEKCVGEMSGRDLRSLPLLTCNAVRIAEGAELALTFAWNPQLHITMFWLANRVKKLLEPKQSEPKQVERRKKLKDRRVKAQTRPQEQSSRGAGAMDDTVQPSKPYQPPSEIDLASLLPFRRPTQRTPQRTPHARARPPVLSEESLQGFVEAQRQEMERYSPSRPLQTPAPPPTSAPPMVVVPLSEASPIAPKGQRKPPLVADDVSTIGPNMCIVCMDEEKDHLFLPCKHLVCCGGCAKKIMQQREQRSCPFCRAPIENDIPGIKGL